MKAKAKHLFKDVWNNRGNWNNWQHVDDETFEEGMASFASYFSDRLCSCSCSMCSSNRKYDGITLQEKKNSDSHIEQLKEL
jgi:hypothetical protein